MTAHVKLDDRLSILREEDQRVCNVCGRKFKGRQIEIRRFPRGRCKLYCPTLGCPSGPHQWLYPQTPVVSEMAKCVWPVGKQPTHRQVESTLQARGQRV